MRHWITIAMTRYRKFRNSSKKYYSLYFVGYDRAFEPVNELLLQLLAEFESDSVRTEAEGACAD